MFNEIKFKITTNKLNLILFACYSLFSAILILNHEIWLDEAHHWLISANSKTVGDLINNLRYDGHPILWNLLLHFSSEIFPSYYSMKIIHLMIVLATSVVIIFYSPFSTLQKVLILFGYFIFYEYSVISRNYALGVFLILTSAILLYNRKMDYRFFICLILLPQTNLFGLLFSIPLFCFIIPELFKNAKSNKFFKVYFLLAIYFVSLLVALIFIVPPNDHPILGKLFQFSLTSTLKLPFIVMMMSLFSFPDFLNIHWWNSNLFVSEVGAISSVMLLVPLFIFVYFFKIDKKLFWFFTTVCMIIILFTISTVFLSSRYFGYIFIAFLFVLIVYHKQIFSTPNGNTLIHKFGITGIYIILFFQSFAGLTAGFLDYKYQFSGSYETARFIKSNGYSNNEIIASPFNSLPPISLYLEKEIFSPETNNYETFCKWNFKPFFISENEIVLRIKLRIKSSGMCIFVTPNRILNNYPDFKIDLLNFGEETAIKSERYYIYKIQLN